MSENPNSPVKTLKEYTVEELKVIVYDQSEQMQVLQSNIQAIRAEIAGRKSKPAPKEKSGVKPSERRN